MGIRKMYQGKAEQALTVYKKIRENKILLFYVNLGGEFKHPIFTNHKDSTVI